MTSKTFAKDFVQKHVTKMTDGCGISTSKAVKLCVSLTLITETLYAYGFTIAQENEIKNPSFYAATLASAIFNDTFDAATNQYDPEKIAITIMADMCRYGGYPNVLELKTLSKASEGICRLYRMYALYDSPALEDCVRDFVYELLDGVCRLESEEV